MERTLQKRIEVDGSWVMLDVYGDPDADAIVIVPGVMADAAAWQAVAQRLQAWKTVAVVNRRGRETSGPLTPTYSLRTEVEDAAVVCREFSAVRTLFGWSYGGLIALHLANELTFPQVVAYEPVMAPFGAQALSSLRRAHDQGDHEASVEIALRRVTGMGDERVATLRGDVTVWEELQRLSAPLYHETLAINEASQPARLATGATQVDLIIGELNQGRAPYGTSFEDVTSHVPQAEVHGLGEQGHLAHLEAPTRLAALMDDIGRSAG